MTDSGTTVVSVPEQPAGLGWLPDGRLLVVSMRDRTLLRREPDGTLGGAEGKTLFACAAPDFDETARKAAREATLLAFPVTVPAA